MANPRSYVVDPCSVQVLHVFNRCVRRTFLFGVDSVSGRDYSHRKEWIRQRLEFLTGIFAFDIATYAVMSNHFHLLVRSRPDIVASWTDEEVAIRNLRLQGKAWFRRDGTLRKSAAAEIERIVGNPDEIQRLRRKLSDLSSLMSYFDRNLATRANQEDEVTGAFWEGTYRAELIHDEASLLACLSYIDLNPIRALMAASLEESDYTGAFDRIAELRSQLATGEFSDDPEPDVAQTPDAVPSDAVPPDGLAPDGLAATDSSDNQPSSRKASTLDWATLNWERENQPTIGWLARSSWTRGVGAWTLTGAVGVPVAEGFCRYRWPNICRSSTGRAARFDRTNEERFRGPPTHLGSFGDRRGGVSVIATSFG